MKLRTIRGKFWADIRVDGRRLRKCLGADRELAELRMTSVERFERVARMMKGDPLFARLLRDHVKSPHSALTVGHVYFVRAGDRVKIGFARVLKRRMTQIQVSIAEPVTLAKSVRGTRAVEREMHARFAAYRSRRVVSLRRRATRLHRRIDLGTSWDHVRTGRARSCAK